MDPAAAASNKTESSSQHPQLASGHGEGEKETPVQLPKSLQASCVQCGEQFSGAQELQSHSLLCCYSSNRYDVTEEADDETVMEEEEDMDEDPLMMDAPLPVPRERNSPQKVLQISSGGFVMPPMDKNKASYYCDICRKNFTNYGSYRRHLRMHFCDKKYSCHLCGRQFFRRYLWVKHQEKIHGNDPSSCRCPHCGLWSKNADSLKEHLRTKHRRTNGKEPTNAASMPSPANPYDPASATAPAVPLVEAARPGRKSKIEAIVTEKRLVDLQECFKCRECEAEFATEAEVEEHCAGEHDPDQTGNASTSRYGRRRKQRVLFNTEIKAGKRKRKSSLSSPTSSPTKTVPASPGPPSNGLDLDNLDGNSSVGSPPPPHLGTPPPPAPTGSPLPPDLTIADDDDSDVKVVTSLENDPSASPKPRKQRGQRGSFYCEKCNRMFINRSSYLRHRKMHTGIKPFTCEFCCISFFRSESLASHKKKHTDPGDIRCYLCGYRAANSAALRTHFYTVCGRDKTASSLGQLQSDDAESPEHQKDPSERDIAGFCSLCNRAFFNQKNFDKHMRLHDVAAPSYSCTVCNKMFSDEPQYQEHVQTHASKPPSSLELLKSFGAMREPSPQLLPIKVEPADPTDLDAGKPEAPLLCCRLCPLAFTSHHSYMKHVKYHEKHSLGFCRYCGKPFTNKKQLNGHERACYMVCCQEDKMYSCYGCSIYFDGTENLVTHVRMAHLDSEETKLPTFRDLEQEIEEADSPEPLDDPPLARTETKPPPHMENQLEELQVTLVEPPGSKDEPSAPIAVRIQQRYKCGRCNDTFGDLKSIFSHFHKAHGVTQAAANGLDSEVSKVEDEVPNNSIMKQLLSAPPVQLPDPKPTMNCGLCFKLFKERSALDHHEQLSHVMVDWYKCDVCGKSGSHETMKSHMLSHMHKVGSVVTAVGADLPDIDSPDDNNNNNNNHDDDNDGEEEDVDSSRRSKSPEGPRNALEVISVLCQLCKKIFSSSLALSKHRHTGYNLSVTHPFICCMPNCGQCFTLREDILAHLKTQHTNSTWNINRIQNTSWSEDLTSGPGPFSQSLLQLSLQTLADNDAKRSSSSSSILDIYETGDTPKADVEEITVEPLLDGLRETPAPSADVPTDFEDDTREEDMSPTPPSSPGAQDNPSYLEDRTKVLLKCDDCDSVFTNPCSWKRHRKLHLGIMKHKCPHCSRMFYRKDHCDKHVKTHTRAPRPKPIIDTIKVEK